jgi:hypothetical protein
MKRTSFSDEPIVTEAGDVCNTDESRVANIQFVKAAGAFVGHFLSVSPRM